MPKDGYKEYDDGTGKHKSDQERWEHEKVYGATNYDYGAKDKKSKRKEKDYDLVVDDDMIDFVQAFTIKDWVGFFSLFQKV